MTAIVSTQEPLINYELNKNLLYVIDNDQVLPYDGDSLDGGYIVIISNSITTELLLSVKEKAQDFAINFTFMPPFKYCDNEVLIAKTNSYSNDLNQELKKYTGHTDVVHVRFLPTLDKEGVIVLDMDSTCIQIECIDEIAKQYGVGKEISEITSQAMHGKLDFKQSLRKRVSLLKDAPTSIIENLRNNLPIMPGFPELVNLLQAYNWKIAIASGGFMPFVNKLKEDFNLTLVRANTFEIEDEHLTGRLIGEIVDSTVKVATLHELCDSFGIPREQSIAIGDGANDLPMITAAGIGFAIHAKPIVREKATATINNFGLEAAACILEAVTRISRLN